MLEIDSPIFSFQWFCLLTFATDLDPLVGKKDAFVLMQLVHHIALKKSIFLQAKKVGLGSFRREKIYSLAGKQTKIFFV